MTEREERQQKLEATKQFYLRNHVEDGRDGTDFDCAVLDAFAKLEREWGVPFPPRPPAD